MKTKEPKLLLSVREAARLLGVGRTNTFQTMMETGAIRVVKVAGRVRVARSEVDRIVREGTEPCLYPVKRRAPKDTWGVAERGGISAAEALRRMKI